MKAIALDSFQPQFAWYRQHTGDIRQTGMKRRVETRDLRKSGKMFLRKADRGQGGRRVQRRERDRRVELGQHRFVDPTMPPQFWSTMHDAVPDGVRRHL